MDLPTAVLEQIDDHLSRSEVFAAFMLLRTATGWGVQDAKDFIGSRFRERYPDLQAQYRNVDEDD